MMNILEIHGRFYRDTIALNKFNESTVSIVPSLIFLLTNFFILYSYCHRYTTIGVTTFKTWLFREITFHWSFFYMSKLWFIFMKSFKYLCKEMCKELAKSNAPTTNRKCCKLFGLLVLSFLSTVPLIIMIIKLCTSNRIPNFLLWVGEDRWIRNEIGMAGHYLDRPPRFDIPQRSNLAYHTRRSSSYEEASKKVNNLLRETKSLQLMKCVKNIE